MTSQQLKEARVKLGLTQKQMATELKTKLSTYQKWESGVNAVPGMTEIALKAVKQGKKNGGKRPN